MKAIRFILILLVVSLATHLFGNRIDTIANNLTHLSDSLRIDSIIKMARMAAIRGDGKEGLEAASWALKKAQQFANPNLIARSRFYLAAGFDESDMIDSSIKHYKIALEEVKVSSYPGWDVHIYLNISDLYDKKAAYDEALDVLYRGLRLVEEKKDTMLLLQYCSNIGYTYDRMLEHREAIRWHQKALAFNETINDDFEKYEILGLIGIAYDDLGMYDSAHYYNKQTLDYHASNGDSGRVAQTLSNIGNTYLKQENWEEAVLSLERSFRIIKEEKKQYNVGLTSINLSRAYTALNRFKEAKVKLNLGLRSAKEAGILRTIVWAYQSYHELYEKEGNYDSTIHYYKLYGEAKDSLFNLKKSEQIADMRTKYETEKKEQEIQVQKLEIQKKESKLIARKRLNLILGLVLLLGIFIFIGVYQRYQAKKKAEIQRLIIEEQEKGLNAVFHAQEEERKRISKELHDGVGQQLSGIKMAIQKLIEPIAKKIPEKKGEMEKLSEVVTESADEIRSISHQMMPRALIELGLIDALEDMLSKSLGITNINYEFEHHGIEERIEERKEVSLYRICQELINNIIKHSEATQVSVHLFKNRNKIILVVEDNGKGISKASADGHGLMNIKNRLNTIEGDVNLEPSPTSGTLATIRIPV